MVVPTFYRRTRLAHEILERLKQQLPEGDLRDGARLPRADRRGAVARPLDLRVRAQDRGARALAAVAEELEARGRRAPRERWRREHPRRTAASASTAWRPLGVAPTGEAGALGRDPVRRRSTSPIRCSRISRFLPPPRPLARHSREEMPAEPRSLLERWMGADVLPAPRGSRGARGGRRGGRARRLAPDPAPRAASLPRALPELVPRAQSRPREPARRRRRDPRREPRRPAALRRRHGDPRRAGCAASRRGCRGRSSTASRRASGRCGACSSPRAR